MFITSDKVLNASELYQQFLTWWKNLESKKWTFAIFEGSPEKGLYSWCPDCNVALTHLRSFRESHSDAKLLNFKVGGRIEWKSTDNPFKKDFPHLQDLPTLILFLGRMDLMRMVAPQEDDFEFMALRAKSYEQQLESGDWHIPERFISNTS